MRLRFILLLAAAPSLCVSQNTTTGKAETHAPCSPAVSGSNNTINIAGGCNTTGKERLVDLRKRTDSLAKQILDFAYAREGPLISLERDYVSAQFAATLNRDPNGKQEFLEKATKWQQMTVALFLSQYWTPEVVPLLDELKSAGVDTYLVTKAAAAGDPRRVGLMLSVVAARIGKQPPFQRMLTPLEASAILKEADAAPKVGEVQVTFYADRSDPNSEELAETLRKTFGEKWTAGRPILPLSENGNRYDINQQNVHIVFPSSDWTTNFEGFMEMFSLCEIETKIDIRPGPQPPMVMKVEVWPDRSQREDFPLDNGLVPPLNLPH